MFSNNGIKDDGKKPPRLMPGVRNKKNLNEQHRKENRKKAIESVMTSAYSLFRKWNL